MLLSVSVGPVKISILDIAKMLLHKLGIYITRPAGNQQKSQLYSKSGYRGCLVQHW